MAPWSIALAQSISQAQDDLRARTPQEIEALIRAGKLYRIQGGEKGASKYSSVRMFFQCLQTREHMWQIRNRPRHLREFAGEFGVVEGTPAWKALIEAIHRVTGRFSSMILDVSERHKALNPEAYWQRQFEFHEKKVRALASEYRRFLQEMSNHGIDSTVIEDFVDLQMAPLVNKVSTEPETHPNVRRLAEIERLFEEPGGNQ